MSKQEKGKIIPNGMGGFLCPPGHPTHTQSVQTDLCRRVENRSAMCLESAVNCEWLEPGTRAAADRILRTWEGQKPTLESPGVQDWIRQVLGYFQGCYNFTPDVEMDWNASHLTITDKVDPLTHADYHAGVHLIRRYYPDYQPTPEQFAQAYWGQKPDA